MWYKQRLHTNLAQRRVWLRHQTGDNKLFFTFEYHYVFTSHIAIARKNEKRDKTRRNARNTRQPAKKTFEEEVETTKSKKKNATKFKSNPKRQSETPKPAGPSRTHEIFFKSVLLNVNRRLAQHKLNKLNKCINWKVRVQIDYINNQNWKSIVTFSRG